jgi:hypothetical protein
LFANFHHHHLALHALHIPCPLYAVPAGVLPVAWALVQTADGAPVKSEKAPVQPKVSLADTKAPKPKVAAPAPAVWKQAAVPLLIIAVGFVLRYYFSS